MLKAPEKTPHVIVAKADVDPLNMIGVAAVEIMSRQHPGHISAEELGDLFEPLLLR